MTEEESLAIRTILQGIDGPVIVEAGCYRGEETKIFESMCTPAKHILIEPDQRNCKFIERQLRTYQVLYQGAVAAEHAEARHFYSSMHMGDGSTGSGSLLYPTGHRKYFPQIRFNGIDLVRCFTLDEIYKSENLSRIDLLWSDVQGGEREMISGGKLALENTRYCFMESESHELYKGQALRDELIALMEGWEVVQIFPDNILLRNGRIQ